MNFLKIYLNEEEEQIFKRYYVESNEKVNITFMWVLIFEWLLAITISLTTGPLTWSGTNSSIHPHVYLAILFGGALTWFPVYFIKTHPQEKFNKYMVCTSQILYSTLLIHLTGGRIETHFHIFGSLAFLAFYRDAKIILLATLITLLDHLGRGAFMPESIYGIASASYWRAIEHAAWVIFEDVVLLFAIKLSLKALGEMATRENLLANSLLNIEKIVEERTSQLIESQRVISEQQLAMANSARLSSLGEMAAGIAHEINNPLAIIISSSKFLRKIVAKGDLKPNVVLSCLDDIDVTVERASKIVTGMRNISRDSSEENFNEVTLREIFNDVFTICSERFKNHSIALNWDDKSPLIDQKISCKRIQISQVLLNLLTNSFDAIESSPQEKWIRIIVECNAEGTILVKVADSGNGIPDSVKQKMFQPFFTTKDIGKGTGLGLSLSKSIMEGHGGSLVLDTDVTHTQFTLVFPDLKKAS